MKKSQNRSDVRIRREGGRERDQHFILTSSPLPLIPNFLSHFAPIFTCSEGGEGEKERSGQQLFRSIFFSSPPPYLH